VCGGRESTIAAGPYCYLLGLYLGDGHIARTPRVWRLRIFLDSAYPAIVQACETAMNALMPGQTAHVCRRRGMNCVEVGMYSKHWPCFFPQHGPGRKHTRHIRLTPWQQTLVRQAPQGLLRGLVHSDGCRIVATERKGNYERRAARYAFSNRSEDILTIFCETCDLLGIRWTRASAHQDAIYRKASVAKLDEIVGPKR
jgi:hypothetical protein